MPANDRARLERLCRYVARPPLASERLEQGPDGRLVYHLRHRWRDGTTHVLFEPVDLLERLAALVPPPRFNLVRYHGVLAPAAHRRALVVSPADGRAAARPVHARCGKSGATLDGSTNPARDPARPTERPEPGASTAPPRVPRAPRPRRYDWADLMRRVFAVDVLECPRCHGAMRILAAIHPPARDPRMPRPALAPASRGAGIGSRP